ncbi:MAG: YfcE family phosphodiesterase [Candidatus Lokiarchaeota archaeon]|nr:YfcE family phosphodiesterase [Candidatus Lokiarchaeota archaeon]MBD3341531.1 YfcE family phosphodiesterase [Candidatus Lokiarchaeota archaeon]
MTRILIIGDSHIPMRASEIPSKIIQKLIQLTEDSLFDYTFFTGDLIDSSKFLEFLNLKTKRDVFKVIGNMDNYYTKRDWPIYQNLELESKNGDKISIGMIHGFNIKPRGDQDQLESYAIEKRDNILVSGHTHKEEVILTEKGTLLLNPGSVTGAWSFIASQIPAFIVIKISIENGVILCSLFRLMKRREIEKQKFYFMFKNGIITRKM